MPSWRPSHFTSCCRQMRLAHAFRVAHACCMLLQTAQTRRPEHLSALHNSFLLHASADSSSLVHQTHVSPSIMYFCCMLLKTAQVKCTKHMSACHNYVFLLHASADSLSPVPETCLPSQNAILCFISLPTRCLI